MRTIIASLAAAIAIAASIVIAATVPLYADQDDPALPPDGKPRAEGRRDYVRDRRR